LHVLPATGFPAVLVLLPQLQTVKVFVVLVRASTSTVVVTYPWAVISHLCTTLYI
jgi:hypothetical protein